MPKYWGKYTLPTTGSSFCIKQHPLAQEPFKIAKIFTIVSYAINSLTNNSKFAYTLANVLISRFVDFNMNFNCASYLTTIPL